jgi:hypothetical protein
LWKNKSQLEDFIAEKNIFPNCIIISWYAFQLSQIYRSRYFSIRLYTISRNRNLFEKKYKKNWNYFIIDQFRRRTSNIIAKWYYYSKIRHVWSSQNITPLISYSIYIINTNIVFYIYYSNILLYDYINSWAIVSRD